MNEFDTSNAFNMDPFIIKGPEDSSNIPHESLGKLLFESINNQPKDALAVIDVTSGESLTFGQLIRRSQNLAAHLRRLNVQKDDIIALVSENSHNYPVVYLAGLFLGAPLHLINPKSTEYELNHFFSLSKPKIVLCTNSNKNTVLEVKSKSDSIKFVVCLDDDLCWEENDLFRIEDDFKVEVQIALICNSSGTTGLPKGVMITHENLRTHLVYARITHALSMWPKEPIIVVVPMFHIYGVHILNSCLYTGATLLTLNRFIPETFLQMVQHYKMKRLYLVPTLINFLITSPLIEQFDLSSVEEVVTAGSPCLINDAQLLINRFKLKHIYSLYGTTETIGAVTEHHFNGSNDNCGKLYSGNELKIVNSASGQTLLADQKGEICLKGNVMKGYIYDAEKTKQSIDSDGFYHTGDFGYYTKNDDIYIIGRIKDIIKYKGFQVSPVELENVIVKHPGVKDVAVIGKPDPRFGELATALVVKEDGVAAEEEEICDFLKTFFSENKWLHGGVRFVEGIPRNGLGKIMRHKLVLD